LDIYTILLVFFDPLVEENVSVGAGGVFSPVVSGIISAEGFPSDVCLIEGSDCLVVELVPAVLVLYEGVVVAALGSACVDDDAF
jgi:hypothetical protein